MSRQHSARTSTRQQGGRPSVDSALLSLIHGLAKNEGYCWASNQFLAQQIECTARTIPAALDRLERAGLIDRQYPAGQARRITVTSGGEETHAKTVSSRGLQKGVSSTNRKKELDKEKKQQHRLDEERVSSSQGKNVVVVLSDDDEEEWPDFLFGPDDLDEPTVECDDDGEPLKDDTYGFLDWLTCGIPYRTTDREPPDHPCRLSSGNTTSFTAVRRCCDHQSTVRNEASKALFVDIRE